MAYTVKKGDTLNAIAKANGTTAAAIMALNPQITNADAISIGWEFEMPDGEGDNAADSGTSEKFELVNVPGKPDVWKIGSKSYLVYTVPDSQPPVYMRWEVPDKEDLQSMFGPDGTIEYNKTLTKAAAKKLGMVDFGSTTDLANFDDDPFASWTTTMETEAAVAPWILDDDYQSLVAMAALEGRALTDAEIQSTGWWQENNEAQREWMRLWNGDQETAQSRLEENRIRAAQQLQDAGVENATPEMIQYMADQMTQGNWTSTQFLEQVRAVSDPYSGLAIDPGLNNVIKEGGEEPGQTIEKEDTVEAMLAEWLGPTYGNWSDEEIAKAAGDLRNDPDGKMNLQRKLQGQRMALFPNYEDENLTYQDIASPWRTFASSEWGQTMDETDPMFAKLLQNNDAQLNGQLLREEGLKQGVGKVEQDAQSAMLRSTGGSVRRAL